MTRARVSASCAGIAAVSILGRFCVVVMLLVLLFRLVVLTVAALTRIEVAATIRANSVRCRHFFHLLSFVSISFLRLPVSRYNREPEDGEANDRRDSYRCCIHELAPFFSLFLWILAALRSRMCWFFLRVRFFLA